MPVQERELQIGWLYTSPAVMSILLLSLPKVIELRGATVDASVNRDLEVPRRAALYMDLSP